MSVHEYDNGRKIRLIAFTSNLRQGVDVPMAFEVASL